MRKIAIIGSKGFIGRHIEWYLHISGEFSIETYDCVDGVEQSYTKIDLSNPDSVKLINVDVDYIFMFAGLTGTYVGFDKIDTYLNINEFGLLNLLNHIRQSHHRPKIIFPSTRLVYKGNDVALREDDEKETKTIYAVNKLACESYLYAYFKSFDIPYTIFRICIPYGNLIDNSYSFGTIGFFLKMAMSGQNITLYGGGDLKRTFTHLWDMCYQIVEGGLKSESRGEIYNVGGETYSLRMVAELIAEPYGVDVITMEWPERDLRIESGHTYFDDSRIQSLLGGFRYKSLKELKFK